jgi:hypothetical protein
MVKWVWVRIHCGVVFVVVIIIIIIILTVGLLMLLLPLLLLVLLLYSFVNMLLIVCIPRDIEYGDLFANTHLILKMLMNA